MDSREPQPPHPHPHHIQQTNVVLMGPNPFANTVPNTMVEPTSARFPPFNMNANPCPHSEPFINNSVPSILNPSVEASSGSGSIKKKRGRPRKYFPDGNIALGSSSAPTQDAAIISPSSTMKKNIRGRGRPCGSFKKNHQVEGLGVTGTDFSAHLINVNHGEDIVAKLTACCQGGSNTEMCILSAHGLVGTAAFHQSGIIVTYEGQFELVSLSGTLEVCDNNNGCKRMGNFKVALMGPGSRLLGGVVANKLIAASSIKVTVGTFTMDDKKTSPNILKVGSSSTTLSQFAASGTPTNANFQGSSYELSGDNENSHFSQGLEICNNASQHVPTMSTYQNLLARQTQL